jgi:hypothetical protein
MAETGGKKRAVRIPLDYYKRPDQFARWRLLLSVLAVVVAVAWAAGFVGKFWSPGGRQQRARELASHGPVARVHAAWEFECEACHAPFKPIGLSSWATPVLGDSHQSNERCQACHSGAVHHSRQEPKDLACASCHHDHQGRDAQLIRHSDKHCTQCHSDLAAHVQGGQTTGVAAQVTRFDAGEGHHPEFRTAKGTDPGKLAFDHERHLTLGMASKTKKFGPVKTLGLIPEADRPRYSKYAHGPEKYIQLDCAACHQLARDDPDRPAPSPPPASNPGYMLPINFQIHCRACHPLEFDPADASLVMEHPLQPEAVHASLWQTYSSEYLKKNPALLQEWIPPRPMPGRPESPGMIEARSAITRSVSAAEKLLFSGKEKGCALCHQYEDQAGKPVKVVEHFDPAAPVRVTPPQVPVVWWKSAWFTHSAHRGVDCRGCHERAYPNSRSASHESKDILLPTMKDCLQCHGPRTQNSAASVVSGGAGFDCTECHHYHNGDAVTMGMTPTDPAPKTPSTIDQFLRGFAPSGKPGS